MLHCEKYLLQAILNPSSFCFSFLFFCVYWNLIFDSWKEIPGDITSVLTPIIYIIVGRFNDETVYIIIFSYIEHIRNNYTLSKTYINTFQVLTGQIDIAMLAGIKYTDLSAEVWEDLIKKRVLGRTLNCIYSWGFSSYALGSVQYPFLIDITKSSRTS